MTKEKILEEFDKKFPADHEILGDKPFGTSKEIKDFISKHLDLYAKEFLMECLPSRLEEKISLLKGFNGCRKQIINNANNKQDNKWLCGKCKNDKIPEHSRHCELRENNKLTK